MKKRWVARGIGALIGVGMAAVALAVVVGWSPHLADWLQGACFGLWLGTLVLRLALTAAPKPKTSGEQLLDTWTRWPGVVLSTVGVGLFIGTHLNGHDTRDALVWWLVGCFVLLTVAGAVAIKKGDRQGIEALRSEWGESDEVVPSPGR